MNPVPDLHDTRTRNQRQKNGVNLWRQFLKSVSWVWYTQNKDESMSFTPSVQYIMDRFHWLPPNQHSDRLQNRYPHSQHFVFWPSGIPSWPNLSLPTFSLTAIQWSTSLNCASCQPHNWSACFLSLISQHLEFHPTIRQRGSAPSISTFKRRLKSYYFNSLVS